MNKKQDISPRGKRKRLIIYITSVILVSFVLSLIMMAMANDTFALTAAGGSTEVVFKEDTGIFGASGEIKKSGLIDSRIWFTLYSRLRGKSFTVKAGSYKIPNAGGYDGILGVLNGENKSSSR